jgi:yeast amino acid transporter
VSTDEIDLRHLLITQRFFSIGGVIGTGLFLGTASALQNGGPIGLLLGYSTMGTISYCIMVSLGEMIAYLPISGGHIAFAERFVDPGLAFAMVRPQSPLFYLRLNICLLQGWNYWYSWAILLPTELSAAAVLINYWNQSGECPRYAQLYTP